MSKKEIEIFKIGHEAVITAIDDVLQNLRSYLHARPKVREFNNVVLMHLSRQNKAMYDHLNEYYAQDREAQKMLEFLLHDLKDIKIKYLIFTDKHSGEMADISYRSFPKEFIAFSREIISRIKMEEEYLFPLLSEVPVLKALQE